MLISAILLFASSGPLSGPTFDKRITLEFRAAPIASALQALSSAAGVTLQADGTVQPEVVLLRLQDTPLRDVLTRLGKTCGGVWTQGNGKYYLGRPADFEAKQAKREHDYNLQRFTKVMADMRKDELAQKPLTAEVAQRVANQIMKIETTIDRLASAGGTYTIPMGTYRDIDEIRENMPGDRFLARLITRLNPELLASIPAGERRVFSTTPTSMELPLDVDLQAAAAQFAQDQVVWQDAATKIIHPPAGGQYRFYQSLVSDTDGDFKGTQIARVFMNVERMINSAAVFISIRMLNASGEELGQATKAINLVEVPDDRVSAIPSPTNPLLKLKPAEIQLALSAQAGGRTGMRSIPVFDPEVIQAAQHPDVNEPLASYASSLLLQAGEARGLNIVADLPDVYLSMLANQVGAKAITADSLMQDIHGNGVFMEDPVHLDKGFLEIDGGTLYGPRSFRTMRKPLADMFSSNTNGDPPLELSLNYILAGGMRSYDSTYHSLRYAASSKTPPRTNQFVNYGQVLAMIKASLPGSVLRNFDLPVSAMDADTKSAVIRLVYFQDPYSFRRNVPIPATGIANFKPRFPGIESDPCEMFPNGLPPDSRITLTLSDGYAIQAPPELRGQFYSLDQPVQNAHGFRLLRRRNPGTGDVNTPPTYRAFTCQTAHMTIWISDINKPFDFQTYTPITDKYVPADELPQAVKDEMALPRNRN